MSRVCACCGKGQQSGNKVSHSNRKYRRTWGANVHKVKLDDGYSVYLCTRCLRTLNKSAQEPEYTDEVVAETIAESAAEEPVAAETAE